MGAKKFFLRRDSNHCPPDPQPRLLTTALQSTLLTYSATEFILALLQSNRDHSKMKNESVKKSLEKSKNVLEEKRKTVKRKICIKKDTHVYYNCYELRSRAIKKKLLAHRSNKRYYEILTPCIALEYIRFSEI